MLQAKGTSFSKKHSMFIKVIDILFFFDKPCPKPYFNALSIAGHLPISPPDYLRLMNQRSPTNSCHIASRVCIREDFRNAPWLLRCPRD